ncbi:class I SAM-dependent methyltransferase [Granulosicoccus sp. 3-233]|uniref:class I SAM-dependent methyltransferase n=1 Tax=Granulosicoccus sp. 3-233 TaxID=3417969 RepID=UPI003D33B7FC
MNILEHAEKSPASVYDTQFVPALFEQWGPIVAESAAIRNGDRVLDVACGTGALTRAAVNTAGASGHVVGLDANPDMLDVARSKAMPVEWLEGVAENLPMPDNRFDAVVSQFGFMFFDDKPAALREMMRVLRPGGTLAVAVCDAIENSAGYNAFAALLDRLFGILVGNTFRAPFSLGDSDRLRSLCEESGIADASIERHDGQVRFASIAAMVSTERACVWTLGGLLDDEQFSRLLAACEEELQPFVAPDGSIRFDMPALIVIARKSDGS